MPQDFEIHSLFQDLQMSKARKLSNWPILLCKPGAPFWLIKTFINSSNKIWTKLHQEKQDGVVHNTVKIAKLNLSQLETTLFIVYLHTIIQLSTKMCHQVALWFQILTPQHHLLSIVQNRRINWIQRYKYFETNRYPWI